MLAIASTQVPHIMCHVMAALNLHYTFAYMLRTRMCIMLRSLNLGLDFREATVYAWSSKRRSVINGLINMYIVHPFTYAKQRVVWTRYPGTHVRAGPVQPCP